MADEVRITESRDHCRVDVGGSLFTTLWFGADAPLPHCWPVVGAAGRHMTRNFPMLDGEPDEARDHPHHRSLWFAHGNVGGVDFWHSHAKNGGTIRHVEIVGIESGGARGRIETTNRWHANLDDRLVLTETRSYAFAAVPEGGRLLDVDLRLRASEGDVTFGDTKEGSMALRVHPRLRLRGSVAGGSVVNSEGVEGKKAWGKRAAWVSYWGEIRGESVGVTVFDHPENLRHPCWWHARDYGLCAANPFGAHDFAGEPRGTGDHTVAAGQTLRLRYRFLFHRGSPAQAGAVQQFDAFASRPVGEDR